MAKEVWFASSPYVSVAPMESVIVDCGVNGHILMKYGEVGTGDRRDGCVVAAGPENGVVDDEAVAPFAIVGRCVPRGGRRIASGLVGVSPLMHV